MSSEQEIKEFLKKKDFYDIMGVSKQCSEAELKKAYRKLALLYHPDKNTFPSAQDAFKKVAAAYDCLSNPEKRRVYDQYGNEEPELHQRHYNQQYHQEASADDIFRAFFGQDSGFEDMFSGFRSFNNGTFVYTSGFDNRRRGQQQQPRARQHFQEQRQSSAMSWCMYLVLIYIFFGSTIMNGLKSIFEEKPYTQFIHDSVYSYSMETPVFYSTIQLIKLSFFARKEYLDLDQFRKTAHEQELERDYLHNLDQECRLNKNTYDNLMMQSRNAWLQSTRDQYIKRANQVDQSACKSLKNFKIDIPNLRQIYGI